jgi:excisionase family DNA binding protein
MKKIYTTGEVAKLLGININTVIKWFDEDKISGFRLPGSRERRITHTALISFMNENKIPMELLSDAADMRERRTETRFPADIPVQLDFGSLQCEAKINNISEEGALVLMPPESAGKFTIGDFMLHVSFLGDPFMGHDTQAKIANVRPINNMVALGVTFVPDDSALKGFIRQTYS